MSFIILLWSINFDAGNFAPEQVSDLPCSSIQCKVHDELENEIMETEAKHASMFSISRTPQADEQNARIFGL